LTPIFGKIAPTDEKEVIRSVLNGVGGDYLEEKENPLKITMQFRHQTKTLPLDSKSIQQVYTANGKILLMVHGLCMNDIQWTRKEHNHGETLAKYLNKAPIYLHYNSGLHISKNGQNLNELLEDLVIHWSVPVEEIVIIAHSIGGLVTRSALYYGQKQKKHGQKILKKLFF